MRKTSNIFFLLTVVVALITATVNSGCHVSYKFTDASVPDSIKTIKIKYIDNRAQYVNPQLAQRLTDKIRQKFISQTKMTQVNSDNPDWEVSGAITDYSFSTSAISGQQVATNRLTVGVHITVVDNKAGKTSDYDVSRSFEFKGSQSFQQAEASLGDEMVRTLTDEIFNKIFSKW